MKKFLLLIFSICVFQINCLAQAGKLDSTFGTNGIVTTFIDSSAVANSIAVQADGKIVTGGWCSNGQMGFLLARYLQNGSLDPTFGSNGVVTTRIDSNSEVISVIIQPDGRILAGGWASHLKEDINHIIYTLTYMAIARYNANGSLDTSFNHNGIFTLEIDSLDAINSLALQSDGKIIVGGRFAHITTNSDTMIVLRLNTNGTLDFSFGTHGKTEISPGIISTLIVLPDDKIYALGTKEYYYFAISRYNANGTPDNSFGQHGVVFDSVAGGSANSLKIQSDGKLVVTGTINFNNGLIRYLPDGNRDSSFGRNGEAIALDSFYNGYFQSNIGFLSSALQSDGKILAGGIFQRSGGYAFEISRFNSNGFPDSSFGINGQAVTKIDSTNFLYSIALQSDGKILACGWTSNTPYVYAYLNQFHLGMALTRYLSSPNVGIIDFALDDKSLYIYPNPMHGSETLSYTLKASASITITMQDMEGRLIKTFTENEKQEAGEHKQVLAIPADLPASAYIISIASPSGRVGIKVVK